MDALDRTTAKANFDALDIRVNQLIQGINKDTPKEEVALLHGMIEELKRAAGEWLKSAKEAVLEYIEENGEFEVGGQEYSGKRNRTVKCVDTQGTIGHILDHSNGDESTLANMLGANPFKQGSVRSLIGDEDHSNCFETKWDKTLCVKTGKPKKHLQVADTKFLPNPKTPN